MFDWPSRPNRSAVRNTGAVVVRMMPCLFIEFRNTSAPGMLTLCTRLTLFRTFLCNHKIKARQ